MGVQFVKPSKQLVIKATKIMKTDLVINVFTLLIILICSTNGQEFSFGRCPPFPTVGDFSPEKYSGKWFEYANYFAFFQLFGKCVTANYRVLPSNPLYGNNVQIEVINRAINSLTGAPIEAKGSAILND